MVKATLRVVLLCMVFSYSLSSQAPKVARFFSATIANDVFFLPVKTDRYYTSGIQFEWGKVEPPKAGLTPMATSITKRYWQVSQDIFTPNEIESSQLVPNDRPFASYLIVSRGHTFEMPTLGFRLRRQWTVGVLGKYSLGGQMQNAFHNMIDFAEAIPGWVNEVRPDLLLNYEVALSKSYPVGRRAAAHIRLRGRLGTLYTDIRPRVAISVTPLTFKSKGQLQIELSVANRFVGYNATLTGGLLNRDDRYRKTIIPHRSVWNLETKADLHYAGYILSGGVCLLGAEFKGGMHHVWAWFGAKLPM